MMMLYAVRIWPYLTNLGYTHVMRLDDDSYIYSRIRYNMFEYMRRNDKRYAFRQPVMELNSGKMDRNMKRMSSNDMNMLISKCVSNSRWWILRTNRRIHPKSTTWNHQPTELVVLPRRKQTSVILQQLFHRRYFIFLDVRNLVFIVQLYLHTLLDPKCTYTYQSIMNNFSPPASTLLKVIDESKKIYEERLGDLFVQSVLVRLFMPLEQILWIRDFTYEHTTLASGSASGSYRGCFQNGGISRGVGVHTEDEWEEIADLFEDRFSHNPACNKPVRTKSHVGAGDIERCEDMGGRCGLCLAEFSSKPDF